MRGEWRQSEGTFSLSGALAPSCEPSPSPAGRCLNPALFWERWGRISKPWLLGTPGYHSHHRLCSLCIPSLSRLCTPELHLKTSPLIASFVGEEKLLSSKAEQDVLMQRNPEQYPGGLRYSCRQKGAHLLPCPRFQRKHHPISPGRLKLLAGNTWQGMLVSPQ